MSDNDTQSPEAIVTTTRYRVSCLPNTQQAIDRMGGMLDLSVEQTAPDRWAVRCNGRCYDIAGQPDYEPIPSYREDEWLDRFRFDLPTAMDVARRVAPTLVSNGTTVRQALTRLADDDA